MDLVTSAAAGKTRSPGGRLASKFPEETKMRETRTDQTLKLKDGRTLGFAQYGDLEGKPVLEFHGNPSSRLGSRLFDEAARRMGVCVIGVDRPGMGLSDGKPHRKLLDWPDDVVELADRPSGGDGDEVAS